MESRALLPGGRGRGAAPWEAGPWAVHARRRKGGPQEAGWGRAGKQGRRRLFSHVLTDLLVTHL